MPVWMKSTENMRFACVFVVAEACGNGRMVSDGGPDLTGIFSGEKEARRCQITQHGHTPLPHCCQFVVLYQR